MYALDPDIWHKWDEDVADIPRFGSLSFLHASHDVQVVHDAASVLSECKVLYRVNEVRPTIQKFKYNGFQHSSNLPLDIEVKIYASVVDVLSLNKRSDFNNLQTLLTKLNVSHAGLIRHWPPHSTFVLQK